MIEPLIKGRLRARPAMDDADRAAACALRQACFGAETIAGADVFDTRSTQILVEDTASDTLVSCFRLLSLERGSLTQSYAAQFYELSALAAFGGRMLELGRFCVAPGCHDPDVVRIVWAAITEVVDRLQVDMLFGCTSFQGVDPDIYLDAFALLRARHVAPASWSPARKAAHVYEYAEKAKFKPNLTKAWRVMPPLLRSYLAMGGRVSDHAVVDYEMNTLHVFTGLEVAAIPAQRKRLLRALV